MTHITSCLMVKEELARDFAAYLNKRFPFCDATFCRVDSMVWKVEARLSKGTFLRELNGGPAAGQVFFPY